MGLHRGPRFSFPFPFTAYHSLRQTEKICERISVFLSMKLLLSPFPKTIHKLLTKSLLASCIIWDMFHFCVQPLHKLFFSEHLKTGFQSFCFARVNHIKRSTSKNRSAPDLLKKRLAYDSGC